MPTRASTWFYDMDKTSILRYSENIPTSWDMLIEVAGLQEVGRKLWERYHPFPDQYSTWIGELTSHCKGREAKPLQDAVIAATQIRPGLGKLVQYIRDGNPAAKQGILTAGLDFVAEYVTREVGFDFHEGIVLKVDENGRFSGEFDLNVSETDKVKPAQKHLVGTWADAAHTGDGRSDLSIWEKVGHAYGIDAPGEYQGYIDENFPDFRHLRAYLQRTRK